MDTFQLAVETCVDQRQDVQTKSRDDQTRHISVHVRWMLYACGCVSNTRPNLLEA